MTRSAPIGFDRRLHSEWLDAIASKYAAGARVPELRKLGQRLLRSEYPGDDARRKTLTVIFHLWVDVPPKATSLRDGAAKLLPELHPAQRVALHWGLALATYPFFRDVADAAGRLLALQGSVSLAQVQRRLAERWGQRSTAERAAQRIVRSWIDWGVLKETNQRGVYAPGHSINAAGPLASWLVEALLVGVEAEGHNLAKIRNTPLLFPFRLSISAHELRHTPRLAVHRERVDEDMVTLRTPGPNANQRLRGQLSLLS